MSGSGGGFATITTLLRQLVQAATGVISAINTAAPVTSSQPANQFLASPSASAGTPAFRAITQADLGAIKGATPVAAENFVSGGGTAAATTAAFVAPSDGAAVILGIAFSASLNVEPSIMASAGGLVVLATTAAPTGGFTIAYLPMSSGESSTFTVSSSSASGTSIGVLVTAFFLPMA